MMSLPNVEVVRERIETIRRRDIRNCFMATYLFAGRISEVVGKATMRDTTTARGPRGTDVNPEVYKFGNLEEPAAVFKVKTAKRGGRERRIGLPFNPDFEPWTKTLYDYFEEVGNDIVFPFTRQKVWSYAENIFEDLYYPIEEYILFAEEKGITVKKAVSSHERAFRLHALRHLRASELVEVYGFTGVDLSIYGGWTLQRMAGLSNVMARYLNLSWQSYFPKLLKKRR